MSNDELYNAMQDMLINSALGVHGMEQTLPALAELLDELLSENSLQDNKRALLPEHQITKAWPSYRRDLAELSIRLRQPQKKVELLSWLVMFLIDHCPELARISALHEPQYQHALDTSTFLPRENELVLRADWQAWAVDWLRNALRN